MKTPDTYGLALQQEQQNISSLGMENSIRTSNFIVAALITCLSGQIPDAKAATAWKCSKQERKEEWHCTSPINPKHTFTGTIKNGAPYDGQNWYINENGNKEKYENYLRRQGESKTNSTSNCSSTYHSCMASCQGKPETTGEVWKSYPKAGCEYHCMEAKKSCNNGR